MASCIALYRLANQLIQTKRLAVASLYFFVFYFTSRVSGKAEVRFSIQEVQIEEITQLESDQANYFLNAMEYPYMSC